MGSPRSAETTGAVPTSTDHGKPADRRSADYGLATPTGALAPQWLEPGPATVARTLEALQHVPTSQMPSEDLLQLQRQLGNRATGRLLRAAAPPPSEPDGAARSDRTGARSARIGRATPTPGIPTAVIQRRKGIPADKMVQVYDNGQRWYGQVTKAEDGEGNYQIRLGGGGPTDVRTVPEKNVELHPLLHGPEDWKGERTLGALMMQTGSVQELEIEGSGPSWETIAAELATPDPDKPTKLLLHGFPVELCTAYYSPKGKTSILTKHGKRAPAVVEKVKTFLEQFMKANGQWPYIERQEWYKASTHVVAIEINYYSDRSGSQKALGFHKDTAGDNIFVNLIFDNKKRIAATEWFPDVVPQGKAVEEHQSKLQPPQYRAELESVRKENLYMFGPKSEISGGVTKGANSYVSWVDDAVWHATPHPHKRTNRDAKDIIGNYDDFDTLTGYDEAQTVGAEAWDESVDRATRKLNKVVKQIADLQLELEKTKAALDQMEAQGDTTSEDYKIHQAGYQNDQNQANILDARRKKLQKEKNREVSWKNMWEDWLSVLGVLGEWDKASLHAWLKTKGHSVRDVETWAYAAWQELYSGKKDVFEQDVTSRAQERWPDTPVSEAIAEEDKVGSKSMLHVPPTLSGRSRSTSVNATPVEEAIADNKDIPRRFIRTWVRMVPVTSTEIDGFRDLLVPKTSTL